MLVPKLVTTLKTYNREQFLADLTAGIMVGIVALPLAIAFAIASGLTPERGLYTAVVAGHVPAAPKSLWPSTSQGKQHPNERRSCAVFHH